jgi:hypothetical protein
MHFNKGSFVWIDRDGWRLAEVLRIEGSDIFICNRDGTELKATAGELFPANPPVLDGVEDMIGFMRRIEITFQN